MSPTGTIALAIRSALVARLHWRQSARPDPARSALRRTIGFAQERASGPCRPHDRIRVLADAQPASASATKRSSGSPDLQCSARALSPISERPRTDRGEPPDLCFDQRPATSRRFWFATNSQAPCGATPPEQTRGQVTPIVAARSALGRLRRAGALRARRSRRDGSFAATAADSRQ
jgi:hypothetical protein